MDRIYVDLCCLKRPFDDQRQERVRREAEAVVAIIELAEHGRCVLVKSPALLVENDANPREDRRVATSLWLNGMSAGIPHSPEIASRARALQALGFGVLDALHLAFAEAAGARWFLTCDDRIQQLAKRHVAQLRVAVVNPCDLPREATP